MKCLCQTEEEKSVAWHSDARSLERQGIPREFTTKSRVVIISNDWKTLNKNVAALQDRGHVLLFEPGAAEVHAQAGKWFEDREIYEWFAANLHLTPEEQNPRARLAAELLSSPDYDNTASRVRAFVDQGGGCRATFYNYRRRLGGGKSNRPGA